MKASQDKFKDFWEATAKRFATSGFKAVCTPTSIGLVNWYSDILQKTALKPILDAAKGAWVLDIGCGVGRWSSRLLKANANVIGIDFAENMVREAERRQQASNNEARAQFAIATAQDLPFKDSMFDCALSVTVLQHVVDDGEAKKSALELIRVVKPGGKIIVLEISLDRKRQIALDFPTAFRSTAEWIELFTQGQKVELQRIEGVDLSIFAKPLYQMKSKFTSGKEYASQLSGNASVKFAIIKGTYYVLLNIAIFLSLPFDLALRAKLVDRCAHKLFVFKKLDESP